MNDAVVQRDASGFRLRGLAMTRIETFTDAAFAFALTLLVISLEPPTDMAGLRAALVQVPGFILSAMMLMVFWWGHHEWSRRYGLDDSPTFALSCLLVCTVLIYVYPLRFMFGVMMTWIGWLTGAPVGGGFSLDGPADINTIFVVYGIGFMAMSVSLLLLNVHAWRLRDTLELDTLERHETRNAIGAWCLLTATGACSILVALFAPLTIAGLPGWVYATLGITMPLYGVWMSRRRPAPPASAVVESRGPAAVV